MAQSPLIFTHKNASREGEHGGICYFLPSAKREKSGLRSGLTESAGPDGSISGLPSSGPADIRRHSVIAFVAGFKYL